MDKKIMFYFNHLKKLILKIRVNLVLSKILHFKFVHKKNNIKKRFN